MIKTILSMSHCNGVATGGWNAPTSRRSGSRRNTIAAGIERCSLANRWVYYLSIYKYLLWRVFEVL